MRASKRYIVTGYRCEGENYATCRWKAEELEELPDFLSGCILNHSVSSKKEKKKKKSNIKNSTNGKVQ